MSSKVPSGFDSEINLFVRHIDSIASLGPPITSAVSGLGKKALEELRSFEEGKCEVSGEGKDRKVDVPYPLLRAWRSKNRNALDYAHASGLLPRAMIVTLVSQYDAYLGRLIRAILIGRPGLMSSSERQITFEQLVRFSSLDEVKENLLEQEVEGVLRSSHADHFKWMEKKFSVTLTKGVKIWPEFIELTERRNLFVHTDGKVSSQYLSVCKSHKCTLEDGTKEGRRLVVSQDYLTRSSEVIFLMGVMLGHVLWRKLFPDERQAADSNLVRISYELIDRGDYGVATPLLDFATEVIPQFFDEQFELMFVINRAQAYRWSGDAQKCEEILNSRDWSAKGYKFQLAHAVLMEEWARAAKIMVAIGKDGGVNRKEYASWPLFNDFRKHTEFRDSFKLVFGEEFTEAREEETSTQESPAI